MRKLTTLGMIWLALILSIPPPSIDHASQVHTHQDSPEIHIVAIKKRKGDLK